MHAGRLIGPAQQEHQKGDAVSAGGHADHERNCRRFANAASGAAADSIMAVVRFSRTTTITAAAFGL